MHGNMACDRISSLTEKEKLTSYIKKQKTPNDK